MTKAEVQKVEQVALSGRPDVEGGQVSGNRGGRHRLFRRLILILSSIALGHCLILWYLQWWAHSSEHAHQVNFVSEAEDIFLSIPDATKSRKLSRQYAGKPHLAGSDGDLETAEFLLAHFEESFGIAHQGQKSIFDAGSPESQAATRGITERDTPYAWIDTYYTSINIPVDHALQIVEDDGSVLWDADLTEHVPDGDNSDQDAVKYADAVPAFHGMSADGDATGHLVNGNYCSKEDYDGLLANEAPLEGSIVLCRYGGIVRGLKIKAAQENGAVGVLIYSDPRDDGLVTTENGFAPYPAGPARNPTSVERGSVLFLSLYPGDPTTPGYPSYPNATRSEGTNVPSIPSLPISWNNAKQLLKVLESGNTFERKRIRVYNGVETRVRPIWNVMGVIPGHIRDEVVVAGNHRDAWVMGAVDPSSGSVSTHEVIRGLGHLVKSGWKPLRTIVIGSWDAEEYGLYGSTEWGEDFADWIDKHVVAYFNLDSAVSGSIFGVAGSPLLAHFIRDTAQDITHPTDSNRTLWDARNDDGPFAQVNYDAEEKNRGAARRTQTELEFAIAAFDELEIPPMGSGSDFTVFVQRNGVPSNSFGFGSALNDPVYHYHSVFDTPTWQERYGDPSFSRHVVMAKFMGLQIMRMATDLVLPLNTTHSALQLEDYLDGVERLPETEKLGLDLTKLRNAIHRVQKASFVLDEEKQRAIRKIRNVAHHWWSKEEQRRHRHHSSRPGEHGMSSALDKIFYFVKTWVDRNFCFTKIPYFPYTQTSRQALQSSVVTLPNIHDSVQFSKVVFDIMSELEKDNVHHDHASAVNHRCNRAHKLGRHHKWRKALTHPIQHIQKINKKLRSFEPGFISEDGIKDREWFRHLGVAPGKWLGYGATTFPGLTEAIVFDQDKDSANFEMERLISLLDRIAAELER